jgi:predicted PurR-regulated permease PerM
MRRTSWWITLDLILATVVAILGNIVAMYLQDQFKLTKSNRIGLVVALFIASIAISLTITLRRFKTGKEQPFKNESHTETWIVNVHQRVKKLYGQLIGVKAQKIIGGMVKVKQRIFKVSRGGNITGVEITGQTCGGIHDINQKVKKIDENGTVIGVTKDN